MKIHYTNHTRPPDGSTHRQKSDHESTDEFKVIYAGTECGIALQAKSRKLIWEIELSPAETKTLIESLLRR